MTRQRGRKRTPFGVMSRKMTIDSATHAKLKSSGLVPRWINDEGTRLMEAQDGDYDFVNKGDVKTGDTEDKADDRVFKTVGRNEDGSPKRAYLMAIREEYYKEDQEAKEENNLKVDDAIRGGQPKGLNSHGINPEMGSTNVRRVVYKP